MTLHHVLQYCHRLFVAVALLSTSLTVGSARAQHGDVWLSTDVANNKVKVGVVDEAGGTYTSGVRVLEAFLLPDALPFSPFDYSAEDPGFRAAAGDLPASQSISLNAVTLSRWNGAALELATGVSFNFDLGGGLSTESDGSLHGHPLFGLTDLTADALPVPDGVYVASFRAGVTGLSDSDSYYFVLLKDELIADEADVEALEALLEDYDHGGPAPVYLGKDFSFFEEAVEHVSSTVPEPVSAGLTTVAALALLGARRRSAL
jgi:hypothetical protein